MGQQVARSGLCCVAYGWWETESQRSENAKQWSVEHPKKDWSKDLRIDRNKKRRLKRKEKKRVEAQHNHREKRVWAEAEKGWKCRGREAQAWNWKSVEVWKEKKGRGKEALPLCLALDPCGPWMWLCCHVLLHSFIFSISCLWITILALVGL